MKDELVEAVARAICSDDPDIHMGDATRVVAQRVEHEWRGYVSTAKAALAAMQPHIEAAYQRGQEDMRERAAGAADARWREMCSCHCVGTAIRALPIERKPHD